MPRPRTIHDFYGFPDELFATRYAAPGDPQLAAEIAEIVKPTWVGLDKDSWGIDHGAWSVLVHAFPHADIPVVQLSVNALKSFDDHLELATRLAPLRDRDTGVLVMASGHVVHNLGRIDWNMPDTGFDWAQRFDEDVRDVITTAPHLVVGVDTHDDYAMAVPTPDHFIPLLYLAGLAAAEDRPADVLVDGYAMGSLSMTSYTLGVQQPHPNGVGGSPPLPHIPADETNM
jgi:4,5-DOPA dioxygenase extradiol